MLAASAPPAPTPAALLPHCRQRHVRVGRTTQRSKVADCRAARAPASRQQQHQQHQHQQQPTLQLLLDSEQQPSPAAVLARSVHVLVRLLAIRQQASAGPQQQQQQQQQQTAVFEAAVQQQVADLGPLWVKLGQTLGVRPDVVGERLAAALRGLQDAAPPFSSEEAFQLMQAELGAPPEQLFASISPQPVASASLGQVHRATLLHTGAVVAVKVQRPGVRASLALDVAALRALLALLRAVGGIKQDIRLWADSLAQGLAQELDYVHEGANLEKFAAAHAHLGYVATPSFIWPLTTPRVLTTTWAEGRTPRQILHSRARAAARLDLRQEQADTRELLQLVELGIQATLHQLVSTGLIHGDPHTSNLIFSSRGGPQLTYIDFGLLIVVPEAESLAMLSALLHWAEGDWHGLAQGFRAMRLLKPTTDLGVLAADLQQRFEALHADVAAAAAASTATSSTSMLPDQQQQQQQQQTAAATASGLASQRAPSRLLRAAGSISFSDFSGVVAGLALKYRFELPPHWTLVLRALSTLEGVAVLAEPGARFRIARAAAEAAATCLVVNQSPAARRLLRQLLLTPQGEGEPASQQSKVGPEEQQQQPEQQPTINLLLLEDLLQLMMAQQRPDPQNSTPANQWQRPQQQAGITDVCRQLGLSPAQVAAQLSGPAAAGVRALLVRQHWRWRSVPQALAWLLQAGLPGVVLAGQLLMAASTVVAASLMAALSAGLLRVREQRPVGASV